MKILKNTFGTLCFCSMLVVSLACPASGSVTIANVEYMAPGPEQNVAQLRFDISWDNSWRGPLGEPHDDAANWDAVWVFVKYREAAADESVWSHAWLAPSGHEAPPAVHLEMGEVDGKNFGVFIYRSEPGTGTISLEKVQLRLAAGTGGIKPESRIEVSLHAVEMVYIPGGPFYAGAGASPDMGGFVDGSWKEGDVVPYRVSGEGSIQIADEPGKLWSASTSRHGVIGPPGVLNAAFPKGYAPFYCMKYPVTQGQYADFLNKINKNQAANRLERLNSYPAVLSGEHPGFTPGASGVPCVGLSWADGCAYAVWSGLRPMTELEFEKMCRAKTVQEKDADKDQTAAGHVLSVLYWGPMEYNTGLWERIVTVGKPEGRSFKGSLGNGALTDDGFAPNNDWPGYAGGRVADCEGTGFRGGDWLYYSAGYRRGAARRYASFSNPDWDHSSAWRGVRPGK